MQRFKPTSHSYRSRFRGRRWLRRFRRSLQSRSVLGLLLFGFLLVVAPLAMGLIISGNQIDRLSRDSEQLLAQAIDTGRSARAISDRVTGLERAARQYRVLRDAEALANLSQQRQALRERIQQLNQSTENETLRGVLGDLMRQESELIRRLYAETPSTEWTPALADGFAELAQSVNEMSAEVAEVVEQSAQRLEQSGRQARANAWIQLVLILPFAVILAIVFTRMINRPIQQLDRGIRELTRPDSGPMPQVDSPRDLRALSLRLEWVRRRLLRVEKDRQRLLGQASHELKTPLSALSEGISLLDDELLGPLLPPQLEVVEIMQRNVQQLQAQIDTLLRYNRARTELETRVHEPVRVAELIDRAVSNHHLSMTARNIRSQIEVEPELYVKGDTGLLLTAFDNLISNAVKYSPSGARLGLFVSVNDQCVLIDVADQGPGIERKDREQIFDPFFRGRQPDQDGVAGSGLGLTICRDLIRAHDGDVVLIQDQSTENDWSTIFRVILPHWQAEHSL